MKGSKCNQGSVNRTGKSANGPGISTDQHCRPQKKTCAMGEKVDQGATEIRQIRQSEFAACCGCCRGRCPLEKARGCHDFEIIS
jgi:hypothetical protein